ncbi:MAG TPA: hypothetical protein VMZ27_14555 [Candidatus Saccharimonadales bacterium]|nr:hypothetical protein [Candidatus Saccharimonadales bacterium]
MGRIINLFAHACNGTKVLRLVLSVHCGSLLHELITMRMNTEFKYAETLVEQPSARGAKKTPSSLIYLAALRAQRKPRFAMPIITPCSDVRSKQNWLRTARAAEMAAWEATGGDVLRSELTR